MNQRGDAALMLAIGVSMAIAVGTVAMQTFQSAKVKTQLGVLDSIEAFGTNESAAWQMVYRREVSPSHPEGVFEIALQNRVEVSPAPSPETHIPGTPRRLSSTLGLDSGNTLVRRLGSLKERLASRDGRTFYCGESVIGGGATSGTCLVEAGSSALGCGILPECGGIDLCPGSSQRYISSEEDFRNMESGNRYRLTRDLDFRGGSISIGELDNLYIDGGGHEIRNVALSSNARTGELAMIGKLGNAVVKNLTLRNITVTAPNSGSRLVLGTLVGKVTGNFCGDGIKLENIIMRASGDTGVTGANLASSGGLIGRVEAQIHSITRRGASLSGEPDTCTGCVILNSVTYLPQTVVIQDSSADVDVSDTRSACATRFSNSDFITSVGGWVGGLSVGTTFKFLRSSVKGRIVGWANVGGVVGNFTPLGSAEIAEATLSDLSLDAPNGCNRSSGSVTLIEPTQAVGGLIGNAGPSGPISIKNVTAQNLSVQAGLYAGGLIGMASNRVTVEGARISGQINSALPWKTAGTIAGGMFGWARAEVKDSEAAVDVYGAGTIGGIGGALHFDAINVSSDWRRMAYWYPVLLRVKTSGNLVLEKATRNRVSIGLETDVHIAGGLAGFISGGIRALSSVGATAPPHISRSWSSMNISSPQGPLSFPATLVQPAAIIGGSGKMGGLVGMVSNNSADGAIIEDSYATGRIEGTADMGGLVGVSGKSHLFKIRNCYFSGQIVANAPTSPRFHGVLGLVGNGFYHDSVGVPDVDDFPYLDVTASFWDPSRVQRPPAHPFTPLPANGTGISATQFRDRNTFVGWDFTSVWYPPSGGPPLLR